MCDNLKPTKRRKVRGFKVVIEDGGEYYSPAMGIKYVSGEPVTIPKVQRRMSGNFNDEILNPNALSGYREEMVGRTAVFVSRSRAEMFARSLSIVLLRPLTTRAKVVSATVTGDLLEGSYEGKVFAGRVITFEKEKV